MIAEFCSLNVVTDVTLMSGGSTITIKYILL